ncbi:hypothetical protein NECID01_0479 [Nematocida sp. AWRm77]|nr:hypothetical protein NECID01_0479 [Nematocida sp. AWRm77]
MSTSSDFLNMENTQNKEKELDLGEDSSNTPGPAERAEKKGVLSRLVGHRGCGAGKEENSIASLNQCAKFGKMAEIDVQLTRDREVVVYHDTKWKGVPVEDMLFEEVVQSGMGADLFKDTLAETSIGLNVEIKYEDQKASVAEWVGTILQVVEASTVPRAIVYSSFSREVCEALQARKQPTFFLTEVLTEEAIAYSEAQAYAGIVTDASEALSKAFLVELARSKHMHLATYGEENNHADKVLHQYRMGVCSIITDKIEELSKIVDHRG